ncbi:E3 ubiquitin-protein ligase DTX4-like [Arapaima gigas]
MFVRRSAELCGGAATEPSASAAMLLASAVVVWEWLNEHGRWRPYSATVSHHIEAAARTDPRGGSVVLGQVDSRLAPYIIDLHSMHQFRQDTGTLRPVRRSYYEPTSAPGRGWVWEWENDGGSWTPYDMEVGVAIQAARDRQQPWLDLAPLGFCYLIDFQTMTQINRQTQRRRRIQRRSDLTYPLVAGPLSRAWGSGPVGVLGSSAAAYPTGTLSVSSPSALGQPCTCPQCMLVLSVKASAMAQTLGRRTPHNKLPSPKGPPGGRAIATATVSTSYSYTLPHPLSVTRSLSQHKAPAGFGHSLSLLGGASVRSPPPLPRLPPPPLPPSHHLHPPSTSALPTSVSSSSVLVMPTATLICTATTPTSSLSPAVPGPTPRPTGSAAACTAPLPTRAALAGLSRPALQRIAVAQSRALIASG